MLPPSPLTPLSGINIYLVAKGGSDSVVHDAPRIDVGNEGELR